MSGRASKNVGRLPFGQVDFGKISSPVVTSLQVLLYNGIFLNSIFFWSQASQFVQLQKKYNYIFFKFELTHGLSSKLVYKLIKI